MPEFPDAGNTKFLDSEQEAETTSTRGTPPHPRWPSKAAEEATSEAWNEAVAKARTRRDAQRAETAQAEDAREAAAKEKLARDQAMRTKEVDRENKKHPTVERGKRGDERASTTALIKPIRRQSRTQTENCRTPKGNEASSRSANRQRNRAISNHRSATAALECHSRAQNQRNGHAAQDAEQWAAAMWQSVIKQQHGLFGVWHSTNRAKSAGTDKAIRGALNKIRA